MENRNQRGSGPAAPDPTQLVPYKLKLCHKFTTTGHCKRGSQCTYAHGDHEIGMERPPELQNVTLGEMNARKKGKNMVAIPAGEQHHVSYSGNSNFIDPNRRVQQHTGMQQQSHYEGYGGHSQMQHMQHYGRMSQQAWQDSSQATDWGPAEALGGMVTVDPQTQTQQSQSPPAKTSPKQLEIKIPPKPPKPPENEEGGRQGSRNHEKAKKEPKKEPSPFLPLSPDMDNPGANFWADEPTPPGTQDMSDPGSFSWADQAGTPQTRPGTLRGFTPM